MIDGCEQNITAFDLFFAFAVELARRYAIVIMICFSLFLNAY